MPHSISDRVVFTHREILEVFSGVALAMLMAAMDQTIVATALPTMAAQLGSLEDMPWVMTAYMLTSTATTPIYGKLSDLYGRKGILRIAIGLFLVGSLLCGVAQSMTQLIIFRGLQGLGGGGLMALAFTIIGDVVSPRERGRYQGYIGGVFALASVAGPRLGGVFTEALSWHWIFFINLPVGVAALLMTRRALERLPKGTAHPTIDYFGAFLLMASVSSLLFVVSRGGKATSWDSPIILGLTIVGLGLLGVFIVHERRVKEPILPLHLFRIPVFAVATPVVTLSAMALFAGIIFLPLHLQLVLGAGATESGLLLLPLVFGMVFGAAGGGRLIARSGRYKIYPIVGLALAVAMYLLLGLVGSVASDPLYSTLVLAPLGLGLGLVMPVMTVAVQNAVDRRDLGAATATVGFFRSLGGSVGVALFGAVLSWDVTRHLTTAGQPGLNPRDVLERGVSILDALPTAAHEVAIHAFANAFETLFVMAALLGLIALALTLFLEELPLRSSKPAAMEE